MLVKHTLAAAFATVALAMPLPSLADDTIKAEMSDITLHPFHHASLLLVWNGVSILVDPAPKPGGQEGSPITEFSAEGMPNIILVTHQHGDHYNADILEAMTADATLLIAPQDVIDIMPDDLKAKATPMANGETKEVFGLTIEAVPAYNISADRLKFHPEARGDNGYIVTLGGKRVYIEPRFPRRFAGPIALDAGATPKAALVLVILPEIIDIAVMDLAEGEPFVRGQHRKGFLIHGLETRIVFEDFPRALVLLAHPVERFFAFDGLQP